MEILWPLGEASVKTVWSGVSPERGLAYTTVMTVLEKMHRKGILAQRKKGKAYLYSALLSREQALKGIIEHVRETYFGGSQAELVEFIEKNCPADTPPPAKPATEPPQAAEPPK